MSYTIRTYTNIQELTGTGEEWLVTSDQQVIAIFVEGKFKSSPERPKANEDTTSAA